MLTDSSAEIVSPYLNILIAGFGCIVVRGLRLMSAR